MDWNVVGREDDSSEFVVIEMHSEAIEYIFSLVQE